MLRLSFLPVLLLPSPALAQVGEEGAPNSVIVVTGRGLEEARGEAVYDTIVIDRERLTGSASGRLEEILKEISGFQLFRRSDSRSANPTSQGATLRALGGNASSRALLLLDSVPQTDPFGGWISWPAYDPWRLGSVRVTRGGGSGVNGSGALAGTIELNSAAPNELRGAGAALAYGSRDSLDAHVGLGMDVGAGFLTLSSAYGRGDGFVPIVEEQRGPVDRPSPYEQTNVAVRAIAPIQADVELQANGLWFRDERERGTAFSGIHTDGADASVRLVASGRWPWSALLYVQTRNFYNSFAGVASDRTSVSRVSEQYSVPSTGLGGRFELRPSLGRDSELRLGGDWRENVGETRERFNFQNGIGTRSRVAGGRTRTIGLFAEASMVRGPVTLTGGARLDRWWLEEGFLDERVFATGQMLTDVDFEDRSGWEPTARAGIAYRPAGAVTLRAAAYLGWRLPTLNELYRPFRVGADATAANAALAPERLKGVEMGAEYQPISTVRVGFTLFANRLNDGIANVTLGQGPGIFPGVGFVAAGGEYRQRRNLEAIDARGIEIDGSFAFGAWSLSGGYSYVDAKVQANAEAAALDGLRPAQTPRHSLVTSLAWSGVTGARAAFSARYTGNQFEDDLNQQLLQDALIFDASASLPLTPALSLEARAENLADKLVVAGISGNGIIERATPRTLWVGLRYRQ